MMSKYQYLSDNDKSWHPHMTWFVPGDSATSWGANLPGSPAMAARMTLKIRRLSSSSVSANGPTARPLR